jgi:hypothetical protein
MMGFVGKDVAASAISESKMVATPANLIVNSPKNGNSECQIPMTAEADELPKLRKGK